MAVHIASLLSETGRVLLIDCVDQYDAFKFCCRQTLQIELEPQHAEQNKNLLVIWNPDQERIVRLVTIHTNILCLI